MHTVAADGQTENDARMSTAVQLEYWAQQSVDDNGMLGGFAAVSRVDIRFSRNFLAKLRRLNSPASTHERQSLTDSISQRTKKYAFRYCLDAGAGIGRVSLNLLASICERIDIVEPIEKFTASLTSADSPLVKSGQLRRVYNVPLQDWTAESIPSYDADNTASAKPTSDVQELPNEQEGRYDLIWNQWCLNFLSSSDLVRYLGSLVPLLARDGWIIVKDNISTDPGGEDIFWEEDGSVSRSDRHFRACFEQAGLTVVETQLQTRFPKKLLPLRMYALRPASWAHAR